MKHWIGALLAFTFSFAAHAIAPEDGIWYNPAQPGRGWVITNQNDVMAVSTYTYGTSGAPTWYLSVGTYDDATKRFAGALDGTTGGQCVGCPYRSPSSTGSAGALSIQFIDNERATLTQAGEQVSIQKFYYAYATPNDRLYGEWAYAGNVGLGVGDAEFLVFDRAFTSSDGTQYVALKRRFVTIGTGLGRFDPQLNEFLVLLDASTSFWKAYAFKMEGSRLLDGRWWLYRKTEQLSGPGSYLSGMRIRERNDVGAKAGDASADSNELNREMQALMSGDRTAADPELQRAVAELEMELLALKPGR